MAATQPPKHLSHLLRMLKTKGRYCQEQNSLTIQLLKNRTLTFLNFFKLIDLSFFLSGYLLYLACNSWFVFGFFFLSRAKDWLG